MVPTQLVNNGPSMFPWQKWAAADGIGIPGRDPTRKNEVWFRQMTFSEGVFPLSYIVTPGLADIICSVYIPPHISTSRKLSFEIVKAAVRQLRFDHPAIATQFAWRAQPPSTENDIFAYEVPSSETDVDEWLSKVVVCRDDVLSSTGRWKTKRRGWRCRMGIHLL